MKLKEVPNFAVWCFSHASLVWPFEVKIVNGACRSEFQIKSPLQLLLFVSTVPARSINATVDEEMAHLLQTK